MKTYTQLVSCATGLETLVTGLETLVTGLETLVTGLETLATRPTGFSHSRDELVTPYTSKQPLFFQCSDHSKPIHQKNWYSLMRKVSLRKLCMELT